MGRMVFMAHSTYAWPEALRGIFCRLGQMAAHSGYFVDPLALLYHRNDAVAYPGGSPHSVTIVVALVPLGGDISHVIMRVRLDKTLVQIQYTHTSAAFFDEFAQGKTSINNFCASIKYQSTKRERAKRFLLFPQKIVI